MSSDNKNDNLTQSLSNSKKDQKSGTQDHACDALHAATRLAEQALSSQKDNKGNVNPKETKK